MPGGPLRRTSTRPPDGAGRSTAVEAADRPACLNTGSATDIFPCGSRACPRCRHLVLSGGTKCWHRGQARSHKSWCWLNFLLLLLLLLLLWPLDCAGDANAPHRRPNVGAVMGVARQDAAPAAMGHGWPVAACPISVPERGNRGALASRPYGRARTFWFLFGPSKRDSP